MTDKDKVIQLLLDNGFGCVTDGYFTNDEVSVCMETYPHYRVRILRFDAVDLVGNYRELVGFLYLKYGKVYISEK